MTAVLYSTTAAIRASLGLSSKDLSDEQILDASVALQLRIELDGLLPDHAVLYQDGLESGASPEDKRAAEILQLFCQYHGAYIMTPGLQMYAVQKVSDGAAEMQRFSREELDKTIQRIAAMAAHFRALVGALSLGTFEPMSLMGRVVPVSDPVTDDGTG